MRSTILIILAGLVLAGCQHTGSGAIAARDISGACGVPRDWTPEFQRQIAAELGKIPTSHPFWQLARDAVAARDAIRICRRLGVPKPVIEAIVAELSARRGTP